MIADQSLDLYDSYLIHSILRCHHDCHASVLMLGVGRWMAKSMNQLNKSKFEQSILHFMYTWSQNCFHSKRLADTLWQQWLTLMLISS